MDPIQASRLAMAGSYMETAQAFRHVAMFIRVSGKQYMPQAFALWPNMLQKEFNDVEETNLKLAKHYYDMESLQLKEPEIAAQITP